MTFVVDVEYEVERYGVHATAHDRANLTDEHSASSYGIPVLLFQGKPLGVVDLGKHRITKITASWKKARTGPVWGIIQKAIDAGYPIKVEFG